MTRNTALEQVIQQVRAYYASPEYKKEVVENQKSTKEFLRIHKERCRLDDNVLSQKFNI